jgi:hypothetical protein
MAALVAAIHALLAERKAWMPATSAGMTREGATPPPSRSVNVAFALTGRAQFSALGALQQKRFAVLSIQLRSWVRGLASAVFVRIYADGNRNFWPLGHRRLCAI